MKATQQLHHLGQSLWLDNITRGLLTSSTLGRSISELSVTGLTSNPTIFDQAIGNAGFYDAAIRQKALAGKSGEALAIKYKVPDALRNRLGTAIAMRSYQAYCDLLAAPRWQKLAGAGARPQRLLWASTGTKDPDASDTLYVETLAPPDTINTIPKKTLLAFADHGKVKGVLPPDGGDAEALLAEFARAGVDNAELASELQREGTRSFTQSWRDLMDRIVSKSAVLTQTRPQGAKP